jgi:uncharacterized protein (DUF1786 family)
MAIDYAKIIEDLKNSIVGPVTDAAKKLLADNKDAAQFLEDRAKRIAELGVEYLKASDDTGREAVIEQLEVVKQSIQNEISQVAVNASIEARATFKNVMDVALGVLIKALPVIVAAL